MVAVALPVHDHVDVGSPFYAGGPRPGTLGAGQPVFHKYDNPQFVTAFLQDMAQAAQTNRAPASMLPIDVGPVNSTPDFDVDAYDYVGSRYRKLYLPSHFRFYLAACQMRCLVPGYPAPSTIKKVEFVLRRVAIGRNADPSAPPMAWVPVPDPSKFPTLPGPDTPPMALAPKLTGNTHTWWPMVSSDTPFPDEQRYPMTRTPVAVLPSRALYFGFLPLASGDMWGSKSSPSGLPVLIGPPEPVTSAMLSFGKPPSGPDPAKVVLDTPLVKGPSNFALSPPIMRNWLKSITSVLQMAFGIGSTGPRPKFEPPRLHDEKATDGFAYVVQCVATLEPKPGCLVEQWGAPSLPLLIAPHFDPFGGRPTQIEIPTVKGLAKMLGPLNAAQFAKRAPSVGLKNPDCPPTTHSPDDEAPYIDMHMTAPGDSPSCGTNASGGIGEICFMGIPLFTITAYLMFGIAIAILLVFSFPIIAILLVLKFCIPIPVSE